MRIVIGLLFAVVLTACGQATNSDDIALGGQPAAEDPSGAGSGGAAGGGAAGACLVGATECNDTPTTPHDGALGMCIEGAEDCDDMVVVPDGECSMVHDPDSCPPGGGASGEPGTGEILCDGTEPTASAPPGTDCSAPAEPEGREVKPAPDGLVNLRPIGWDRHTVDGRQLTVHWYSGVEPCHVLHSVAVDETAQRVTVTLREGSADPDAACIEIAEALKTTVRLDQPLGDRKVVDGAD